MIDDIRNFNGIPYKRVTGVLTRAQAIAEAKRIRRQSMMGKILARIDTYQGGYAVWKHDRKSAWARKKPKKSIPPTFKTKHLKKFKLSNKEQLLKSFRRMNARSKYWSQRIPILEIKGKFVISGKSYPFNIALHYYNGYEEEVEVGDAEYSYEEFVEAGGYQTLLGVKIDGKWYGSDTFVKEEYRTAVSDLKTAKSAIRRAYRAGIAGEDVHQALWDYFYNLWSSGGEWDKFE